MTQNALDPLFQLGALRQPAESSASADRERFSSALEAAVDQRPPRDRSEPGDSDPAAPRAAAGSADSQQQDRASDSAEPDEAASAISESDDSASDDRDDLPEEAATLILTTPAAEEDPTHQLAATSIVATLATDEAATPPVVETAAPATAIEPGADASAVTELPADLVPGAGLPTEIGDQDEAVAPTDDAAAEPTEGAQLGDAVDATVDAAGSTVEGEATADVPVAAATTASQNGDSAGRPTSATNPTQTTATRPVDSASQADDSDRRDGESQQSAGRDVRPAPIDVRAQQVTDGDVLSDPLLDAQSEAVSEVSDGAGQTSEGKASSSNELAGGRPWTRIGASRAVHPAAEAEPADASALVDRPRFLQRVSGAIEAAERRGGPIQVRLSPPELGSLRIELVMRHGSLTATLETETASARQVLLDNLPALRARLAEQDIRVEQFDVDVRRDGRETPDHGPSDRQPNDEPSQRRPERRASPSTPAAADDLVHNEATLGVTDAENLDVRI